MQRITPYLWFDTQAKEATELYASLFPDAEVTNVTTIHDTPSGDCDIVSFRLCGQSFMAISAGPHFKFNPSVSFHVKCRTEEEVDRIWQGLTEGGTVLMELAEYPFSKRYGWLRDRYGLSWQIVPDNMGEIMSAGTAEQRDRVTQAFMKMKKFDLAELQRAFEG